LPGVTLPNLIDECRQQGETAFGDADLHNPAIVGQSGAKRSKKGTYFFFGLRSRQRNSS
jgi:hypothetical protein